MEQLWPNAALLGRDGGLKPLRLGLPWSQSHFPNKLRLGRKVDEARSCLFSMPTASQ
jgi:hypothetical protein